MSFTFRNGRGVEERISLGGRLNRPVPLSNEAELLKHEVNMLNTSHSAVHSVVLLQRDAYNATGVDVLGTTFEYNEIWSFELAQGRYFTRI